LEKIVGGVKRSGGEILAVHIEQEGTHSCSYRGSKVVAGDDKDKELDGAGFIILAVVVHCKCIVTFFTSYLPTLSLYLVQLFVLPFVTRNFIYM
jgi:hypothetical protein